jgi:acyl-CoA dehydrogenase
LDEYLEIMRRNADRLFAEHCDRATLALCAAGQWPKKLWSAIEEAGLLRAAVAEAQAGVGLSIDAALDLAFVSGTNALPVPLSETIAVGWLLDQTGLAIPDGPLTLASEKLTSISATRSISGWKLEGTLNRVPYGRFAAGCAAAIPSTEGALLVVLSKSDYTVRHGSNLACEPRDTLEISTTLPIERTALMPVNIGSLHALGATVRTCQMAGAMARIGDQAVSYAQERQQFGRPLSQFQAIQQMLAVLGGQVCVTTVAADMARHALAEGRPFPTVAIAKARAGEAVGVGAAIAHQVHGAMGFTMEHSLHFSTKRLWSWREEFGNEHEWNAEFGRHILDAGADRLWSEITLV